MDFFGRQSDRIYTLILYVKFMYIYKEYFTEINIKNDISIRILSIMNNQEKVLKQTYSNAPNHCETMKEAEVSKTMQYSKLN